MCFLHPVPFRFCPNINWYYDLHFKELDPTPSSNKLSPKSTCHPIFQSLSCCYQCSHDFQTRTPHQSVMTWTLRETNSTPKGWRQRMLTSTKKGAERWHWLVWHIFFISLNLGLYIDVNDMSISIYIYKNHIISICKLHKYIQYICLFLFFICQRSISLSCNV